MLPKNRMKHSLPSSKLIEREGEEVVREIVVREAAERKPVDIANPDCHEEPSSVTTLTGTTDWVSKVICLPSEKLVVAASDDYAIRVYDLDTACAPRATFDRHTKPVRDVVQLDRDLVASVGSDKRLFSRRPKSAQLVDQWKHNYSLYSVAKLDDSRVIIADIFGKVIVLTHDSGTAFQVHRCFPSSHSSLVNQIVVHRDLIVTCSDDYTAKLWNTTSFALFATLHHANYVTSATVSDSFIVTTCNNSSICVYRNLDHYSLDFMFSMDVGISCDVAFLNQDVIAIGNSVGNLALISVSSKSFLSRIQTNSAILSFVVLSDCRIAIGTSEGALIISPPHSVRGIVEQYALRYEKQVFVALRDAIIKDLAERDPFNYPLDFDFVENLKLSEYLVLQENSKYSYSECLSCKHVLNQIEDLGKDDWEVFLPHGKNYFVVKSKKSTYFLMLIDDFFLSFDSQNSGHLPYFSVKVPGSDFLYLNVDELRENPGYFTSHVVRSMPSRILYHLVRRLVQFRCATWEYGCLCDLEKSLAVDGGFWPDVCVNARVTNIFCFKIELYPMNFCELSGCKVGFFRGICGVEDRVLFHSVGMEVFGSTIRFRRFKKGSDAESAALQGKDRASIRCDIAFPVVVPDSLLFDKERSSHITDNCRFTIGGKKHGPRISNKVPMPSEHVQHPSAEQSDLLLVKSSSNSESNETEEACQFRVRQVQPKETAIWSVGRFPVYNLAYLQKNGALGKLQEARYTVDQLFADCKSELNLENDLRKLGYGTLLSKLIATYAFEDMMISSNSEPTVSIAEAQKILLQKWEGLENDSMIPFALTTKARLPVGQCFLVVNGRKLSLLRNKDKVTRSRGGNVGASVSIIPGILNVSANFNYADAFTPADLNESSEVASIGDAVMKIRNHVSSTRSLMMGKGASNQLLKD